MTEEELRVKFEEAVKDRADLKGFWHTRAGKEIRATLKNTDFLNFTKEQEKVWALTNRQIEPAKCQICSKPASFYQYSYLETCGVNCGAVLALRNTSEDVRVAAQAIRVEASKSDDSRAKRKATIANTYKLHGSDIQAKRIQTMQDRYGVDYPLQSPLIQAKIRATYLAAHGVDHPYQNPDVIRKRIETARTKYEIEVMPGRLNTCKSYGYTALFSEWQGADTFYPWIHDVCGHEFRHTLSDGCIPSCPKCRPRSKPEQFIVDYVTRLGFKIKHNDRTLIKPYELDVLIPENSIAIEVNGLYWHHDGTTAKPLLDKTSMVEAQGYQLLHFWDFEISEKPEVVKSIIASKLGRLGTRIGSRQCELREVSTSEARSFLDENHLAGYANSSLKLGLFFKSELVAIATFAKPRFSKEDAIELIRFSTKLNHHIHGALSRLVKHASKKYNRPIVSFADRRISVGTGYTAAGFVLVGASSPNYWYVKNDTRLPRYACMKHKLPALLGEDFNENLSEKDNMLNAGWIIMKDSGNLKFKYGQE